MAPVDCLLASTAVVLAGAAAETDSVAEAEAG
jgi:hypothetical protein